MLLFGCAVSILPIYWMFISGLKPTTEIMSSVIKWFPDSPQWKNFLTAWNWLKPSFGKAFLNSTIVTVGTVGLILITGSLTGYALAKFKFRGRDVLFKFVLATMMFPFFIGLIPSYMLIAWLGLSNTLLGVILPAGASAYTIFFLRQYILTVPDELIEAGRVFGASEFRIYWRIVLPLIKPALVAIGLLNSVWIWNDLLWPMVVLHSRDLATVQIALAGLWDIRGQLSDINLVLSSGFIATVPTLIIAIVACGYLIKGFTGLGYVKR